MATSGTWGINDPSPSLNPQILGEVEKNDRVRQAALAVVAQAAVISGSMCQTARECHIDPDLSTIARHRLAHEKTAKTMLPFIDTVAKTQAIYAKAIETLNETVSTPKGEFSEERLMRAASKLSGTPAHKRFMEVKRDVDRGSDLLIAVLKGDEFLVGDLLSEAEKAVIIDHWQRARFPEETDRLHRLGMDLETIRNTGRILENYQRSMSNASVVAEGLQPSPAVRGAAGPAPTNRGAGLTLEQRARNTTEMLKQAQGGR